MIDFLLGVPGKLKAISDYLTTHWTSARAAKLDLLTVAPAPASTALSNETWTDARAAKIDSVGSSVLVRALAKSTTLGSGSTGNCYGTKTVTAVNDINKTLLVSNSRSITSIRMTSTTVVSITGDGAVGGTVYFTLLEFK